jgi:hypothetical protein
MLVLYDFDKKKFSSNCVSFIKVNREGNTPVGVGLMCDASNYMNILSKYREHISR